MFDKPITLDRFARILLAGIFILAVFYILNILRDVLLPFCIATVLAYLLYPLVYFFQHRMKLRHRPIAILFTLIVVLAALFGLYELVIPPMLDELGKANTLIVKYISGGSRVTTIPEAIDRFISNNVNFQQLNEYLNEENITNLTKTILPRFWVVLSQSVNILFNIFASLIILLYMCFILLDYEALSVGWINLLPSRRRKGVSKLVTDVKISMNRYFRGQALIALCVAILTCIGFLIIDLPMAIAMGLFVGILTLVPYLKVVALIPTILLTFLKSADTGQSFWLLLGLLIAVLAVVQIIEDTYLVPKIMGKITGLNPAIILLSLSIWGSLLGITGMIIALPITSLLLSYYRRYRLHMDELEQEEKDPERADEPHVIP